VLGCASDVCCVGRGMFVCQYVNVCACAVCVSCIFYVLCVRSLRVCVYFHARSIDN